MDHRGVPAASPAPVPMLPGVSVVVETLLLGIHEQQLTHRVHHRVLTDEEHPDQVARLLVGFDDTAPQDDGRMLHSTSWRFSAGRIILTYAALPDPHPHTATVLGDPSSTAIATGAGPLTPSPTGTTTTDVVSHACRHLAFLRHTDPVVTTAARHQDALWALLDRFRPDIAGDLHHPRPRQLSTR